MNRSLKVFGFLFLLLPISSGAHAASEDLAQLFSYKGIRLGASLKELRKRLPASQFDFSCVDYEATSADVVWTDLKTSPQTPRFGECLPRPSASGVTLEAQSGFDNFFVLGSIANRADSGASLTIEASSIGFGIYDSKLAILSIEYDAGEKGDFDVSLLAEKAHDVMALLQKGVEEKIGPPDKVQSSQTEDIFVLGQDAPAKSIVAAAWERPEGTEILLEVSNSTEETYPQFRVRLSARDKAQSEKLEALQSKFEHGVANPSKSKPSDDTARPMF